MSLKDLTKSVSIAAAFVGLGHAAQADPADETSLNHLIAGLEHAGLSQDYLTNRPSGENPSFVTLGNDSDCKILVEEVGNRTYFRPSEDCSCDETIGTPHISPIQNGAFERISNSGTLVEHFRAVGIIDGATRQIVFVPKQSCVRSGGERNTSTGGATDGGCGACNGGSRPDRGGEPGGP